MAERLQEIWRNTWREINFALKIKSVRWVLLAASMISLVGTLCGLIEVNQQRTQLADLKASISEEQAHVLPAQTSAGGAAYYLFHLTYDPPSELAFAALGVRGEYSWKHRLRMLALEGQIYESDPGNPEMSSLGKLDFAYVVSILLPLFIIGLLFDLNASERRDARYELLCATSTQGPRIISYRAFARLLLLIGAIVSPFLLIALSIGASIASLAAIILVVVLHALFWLVVCRWITEKLLDGTTVVVSLFGIWLVLTVLVPVSGKAIVEQQISVPSGGEILLAQREKVNGAWDLPKSVTMNAFFETHPQWSDTAAVKKPFEWKWYYAFQQVGDQHVGPLSVALQQGIKARHMRMGWVAWLSPSFAVERWMTRIAATDVQQHQNYVSCVRDFHKALRDFHYPMLFGNKEFNAESVTDIPRYLPCGL